MRTNQDILISLLDENQWDVFSFEMLEQNIGLSRIQIHHALKYLTDDGALVQIEKGKYRRQHFTDENVIACFMVKQGGIAYWSALNTHGLTEQFPNKVFVQNTSRRGERSVFGIGATFHFVSVKPAKAIGYKTYGYGNHTYQITEVEKTIVDCFDLPQYAGGYNETIKAFSKAKLSAQKMVKYCRAINNIAVTKRLAYLSELLEKPKMDYFLKYATQVKNERYSLFDSSFPTSGSYYRKWRLILNMTEDEILEIANSF